MAGSSISCRRRVVYMCLVSSVIEEIGRIFNRTTCNSENCSVLSISSELPQVRETKSGKSFLQG